MALNWPGLLAWSTKYHDGTAPSNFQKMTDEDRAFLENAMEEAFGKIEDPNQVVLEALGQIRAEDRTDASICTSLEVIDRMCDDPDVSRNIEKLGGVQILYDLARSHGGSIRPRTLELLALLFSNNPNIQEAGFKRGGIKLFFELTRAPVASEDRSKAFRALVALVRHIEAHEDTMLRSEGGLALLVELLDLKEESRTREKVASFVVSLASNANLREEEAGTLLSAVAPLLEGVAAEGVQYREMVAACCLELARLSPPTSLPSLGDAVQARLSALRSAGAKAGDGDEGAEMASLQECLDVIAGRKA